MAIDVTCPNGHQLKIKDKYAGKSGLCPRCQAQIWVPNPTPAEEEGELIDLVPRHDEVSAPATAKPAGSPFSHEDSAALAGRGGSALDDDNETASAGASSILGNSAGESLLSSSHIRSQKVCPQCAQLVPIWYARCTHCDFFFRG